MAHCLEFDIVAAAKTKKQTEKDLEDLVVAQIESAFADDDIESLFHPAPKPVWAVFQQGLVIKTFAPGNLSYA